MKSGKKVKYYLILTVILTLFNNLTYAFSTTYLEKDEIQSYSFPKGSKFVLSNKRVISAVVLPLKEKIMVRSKASGRSNLQIILPSGKTKSFTFIVSNPKSLVSMNTMMARLRSLKIPFQKVGRKHIKILRPIKNETTYVSLSALLKQKQKDIELDGSLDTSLKKKLLEDIYIEFVSKNIESISCEIIKLKFICTVANFEEGIENISANVLQKLYLTIKKQHDSSVKNKFRLKIKILQFEYSDGQQLESGFNNLDVKIIDLINNNFSALLNNKKIFLQELGGSISVVAEPTISFIPGIESKIRIGNEVQQTTINQNGLQGQEWKFFGFDLNFKTQKYGSNYETKYNFRFSTPPTLGQANSNYGESASSLNMDSANKLFEFDIQVHSQSKSNIPWINKIPIFGKLFENKTNQTVTKKIIAYASISKWGESK